MKTEFYHLDLKKAFSAFLTDNNQYWLLNAISKAYVLTNKIKVSHPNCCNKMNTTAKKDGHQASYSPEKMQCQ